MLLANKLKEKMRDPRNAKEHYQSFIWNKNTKPVNQSKTFESRNIVDTKSIITGNPKISHKLSKTIRQKKYLLIAFYIVIQKKVKIF